MGHAQAIVINPDTHIWKKLPTHAAMDSRSAGSICGAPTMHADC